MLECSLFCVDLLFPVSSIKFDIYIFIIGSDYDTAYPSPVPGFIPGLFLFLFFWCFFLGGGSCIAPF
jgi:hypothetical protein